MPTYVRQSAKLSCSMGSAQSVMRLSHPTAPVLLRGSYMAGMTDIKPMANLAPFGLCKSLANPAVAAATAAAGGKLQKMPCIPCVASPWGYAKADVLVKGQPALTDDSRCVCMWLGMIKIKAPGQNSVVAEALPPFVPAPPEPPAGAPEAKSAEAGAEGAPRVGQSPREGAATPKKGLLVSVAAYVKTVIEKAADAVKGRAAAVASSVAAAAAAAVGGVFGRRGKGGEAEGAGEETGTDNAAAPKKCFCDRDIGVDEFEEIVRCLRKSEGINDIALFTKKNCNIPPEDKTVKRLSEEFNKTCKRYNINHCIQKIHFLSQIYHESARFTTALELDAGDRYNPEKRSDAKKNGNTENGDGPKYKGRGLMQLTWRNTQLEYLNYAKDYLEALKGRTADEIANRGNNFEQIISDTLSAGMDSAGWFWSVYKVMAFDKKENREKYHEISGKTLNEAALFADKYQERISIAVNGGGNGESERKKYYNELKICLNIDQCLNLAKIGVGQPPKNTGEAGEAKQNAALNAKTGVTSLGDLHPAVREKAEKLLALCEERGMSVKVYETFRTVARQDELYARGRTKPGDIVTKAQGKEYKSYHQWGLAFDIIRADTKDAWENRDKFFDNLGVLGELVSLNWGGRFKDGDGNSLYDGPHFEERGFGTITNLKKKWGTPDKFMESWKK